MEMVDMRGDDELLIKRGYVAENIVPQIVQSFCSPAFKKIATKHGWMDCPYIDAGGYFSKPDGIAYSWLRFRNNGVTKQIVLRRYDIDIRKLSHEEFESLLVDLMTKVGPPDDKWISSRMRFNEPLEPLEWFDPRKHANG